MKIYFPDRKISAVLLIAAVCCLGLAACKKDTKPAPAKPPFNLVTPNHLLGIVSLDPQHIWIVGFDSAIVHSADGGATWTPQKSPVANSLCDIVFVNPATGWAVGRAGTILHTADGGTTWVKQEYRAMRTICLPCPLSMRAMAGQWAISAPFWQRPMAGATWQKQGAGEDKIYNDVFFADAQHGCVVGEYGTILGNG